MTTPLSILELGRVREGSDRRNALDEARRLARFAEDLGYRRFWIAEHHNAPTVVTSATALVIAHVAAGTQTIRVGAGGVMLPNHSPYVIAEQFGTLETLFPGRIDLGLGRAPGTDPLTLRALRREPADAEHFPQDVRELQFFLSPLRPGQRVEAVPGSGTQVPLWILGSSLFGAQLAAELGLPYGFASHFAPQALDRALWIYRDRFKPSAQLDRPYVLVGVNIVAAPTDAEARFLATSQQISFVDVLRGARRLIQPPIESMDDYWSSIERDRVSEMLACSIIGGPLAVRQGIDELIRRTAADELMIVSDVYDPALRLRSFEIIAEMAGISSPPPDRLTHITTQ